MWVKFQRKCTSKKFVCAFSRESKIQSKVQSLKQSRKIVLHSTMSNSFWPVRRHFIGSKYQWTRFAKVSIILFISTSSFVILKMTLLALVKVILKITLPSVPICHMRRSSHIWKFSGPSRTTCYSTHTSQPKTPPLKALNISNGTSSQPAVLSAFSALPARKTSAAAMLSPSWLHLLYVLLYGMRVTGFKSLKSSFHRRRKPFSLQSQTPFGSLIDLEA